MRSHASAATDGIVVGNSAVWFAGTIWNEHPALNDFGHWAAPLALGLSFGALDLGRCPRLIWRGPLARLTARGECTRPAVRGLKPTATIVVSLHETGEKMSKLQRTGGTPVPLLWKRPGRSNSLCPSTGVGMAKHVQNLRYNTAQRGGAATKEARVCDPQELCLPPSVLTNPARRSLSTCCGSQSRAPQNRRGPRRSGQILIDWKLRYRRGRHAQHLQGPGVAAQYAMMR